MRKIPFLRALALIGLFGTVLAHAATLPYQGLATDAKSNPKSDAAYDVGFSLYASATGGDALWSESQSVSTKKGLFSTTLGAVKEIPDSLFNGAALYLGVSFDGGTEGGRVKLASTPWANRAGSASKAAFADSAAKVAGLSDSVSSLRASLAVQAGDINGLSGAVKKLTGDLGAKDSVGKSHLADSAKVVAGLADSVASLRAALVAKDSVGKALHADTAKVALHIIGADSVALKAARDSVALLTVNLKDSTKALRDSIENLRRTFGDQITALVVATLPATSNGIAWKNLPYGVVRDERDNQVYRTVTIGSQTWMAQNLNYRQAYGASATDTVGICYNNNADTCSKYGRLYTWAQAVRLNDTCNTKACASQLAAKPQGICPTGWHVPTEPEYRTLTMVFGKTLAEASAVGWNGSPVGTRMKAVAGWGTGNGTDSLGFRAIPGGYFGGNLGATPTFSWLGSGAYFRTSTETSATYANFHVLLSSKSDELLNDFIKTSFMSVRCLKD